jgi:hypothetical protein
MKKIIIALGVVLVLANIVGVAWRTGWLARLAPRAPASPSSQGTAAVGQPGAAQPGAPAGAAISAPAGGPESPGLSAAPIPAPSFDGNIALIDFGGTIERTSENYGDTADHHGLIDGDRGTYWTSVSNRPGVGEVVLSFFAREPAVFDKVTVLSDGVAKNFPKDVELLVSNASPDGPFTSLAKATLPLADEASISFAPVEARFLKFRMIRNHEGEELFRLTELQVREAQRPGYVPLLARHRELTLAGGPIVLAGGLPAPATGLPPCRPDEATDERLRPKAAHPESQHVLIVGPQGGENYMAGRILERAQEGKLESVLAQDDLALLKRIRFSQATSKTARPAELAPALGVDTVVLAQNCDIATSVSPAFKQALVTWVAAGHKLIIQDSDDCNDPGPDYSFLPFRFKASIPGAQGAQGSDLRFVEFNPMLNGRAGRPGFLDADAWAAGAEPYQNELGDANVLTKWDANWCGQMAVRNVLGVYGFTLVYAHYGRGLIIYEGFDNDQGALPGYDTVVARELAQPFDPDGLPCGARMGDFLVTTETGLLRRGAVPGRSYTYPLTLIANQGYKGTVSLAAAASPGIDGLQARFDVSKVPLAGEASSQLTLALPPALKVGHFAVEVKGTDTNGLANTLCLQLAPPTSGELAVVSALAPPTKTRKNLEIILDASGSMKTPLAGKRTRWDVALDTLRLVLARLPDDFNVGLRIYGHREGSRSPKTCTDSELIVPIDKLDRARILEKAAAFKPKGETPLVYSALQAPDDLKALGGGTVILITDGEESCKGDPVKAAASLKASGLDIRLNIVGFALQNQRVQKDLAGFAESTGGLFYAANSGAALADALTMAAIERFPYTVYDGAGKEVLKGEAGAAADSLPPGDYKVVVKAGGKDLVAPRVSVGLGQSVTLTIAMRNGQLVLQ